jgi:ATP-binding protein involved in chromosome partitioning
MRAARRVLGVGSGKGGVGKTTASLNLAVALRERGRAVGVLDADLHGPNLPLMVGITRHAWTEDWTLARRGGMGIQPVERHGLKIVSAGFILGEDQPLQIPGATVQMMVSQLLGQTEWGELDYLVVDLPPGTGDVQQALLRQTALDHAVVVVTPQYVAHLDARKAVRMYRAAKPDVLGGIENMAALRCPHCGEPVEVFPAAPADRTLWSMDVEQLGSVPLDPALSRASDSGRVLFGEDDAPSPRRDAFRAIAGRVEALLDDQPRL